MTGQELYEGACSKLSMLIAADLPPANYFEAEVGAMWLLVIADGLKGLMAYCIEIDASETA